MLRLSGISKDFGGVQAVDKVSLSVAQGEVRGLIGPNGAGKTTLVNLISGLLTQSAGEMYLGDVPLNGRKPHERARLGIARTFQNLRVFRNLSVAQNIEVARISGQGADRRADNLVAEAMDRFDLTAKRDLPADALSYGHLRRLEIVRALALRPDLLMLDEPAAGMNETETADLADALVWMHRKGHCALLVIDHDLKFILSLCDQITVMNMGRVIAEGAPHAITKNQKVIDAYLGGDHSHAA